MSSRCFAAYLARVELVLCAVLTIAVPRLLLASTAAELPGSSPTLNLTSGICGLVLAASAFIAAAVLLIEDTGGHAVALTGRRGPAGVRRTL